MDRPYGFIYICKNLVKGVTVYTGQTTKEPTIRWNQHKDDALKTKGSNKAFPFHRHLASDKYDIEKDFEWVVVDTASNLEELNKKETYYIKLLNTMIDFGVGFNCDYGGNNTKKSEQTKKKMSENNAKYWEGKTGDNHPNFKGYIQVTTVDTTKVIFIGQSAPEIKQKVPSVKGGKLNDSLIRSVLTGKRNHHGGYIYKYVNKETYEQWLKNTGGQVDVDAIAECKPFIKVVNKVTKELVYIGESTLDIKRNVKSVKGGKLNSNSITSVLKGRKSYKSHGGYLLEYCTKEEYDNFWKLHNQLTN